MSEFRKHFSYKLLTNIIRAPMSLLLQSLFPRLLGPGAYGDFNFLTDTAIKFIDFIDSGTSTAFYVKLSSQPDNRPLLRFYWILLIVQIALYLLINGTLIVTGVYTIIWPNQEAFLIFLSALYGIGILTTRIGQYTLDANKLTVISERFIIMQLVFSCLLFGIIYQIYGAVKLNFFFQVHILLYIILFIGFSIIIKIKTGTFIPRERVGPGDKKILGKYFINYSVPLFFYTLISFVSSLGERWLLQTFGGSIQQGFFGISFKIAGVVLIFTTAMMPLLMRDFSIFFGKAESQYIGERYSKYSRLLYSVVTVFAVCIFFNADFIVNIIGGPEFKSAKPILMVMAFYPVHQTLGQINGTIFYASHRVRLYTLMGMIGFLVSLLVSFFLIAPPQYFGLNMGAMGLAIGWVVVQILIVNVSLAVNSKYLKTSYWFLFFHQIIAFIVLFFLGKLISFGLDHIITPQAGLLRCIIFSTVYGIAMVSLLFSFPSLFAFRNKTEFLSLLHRPNKDI